jgi:ABC-type dipeptide/oligopeptide/nickel transport system permease component
VPTLSIFAGAVIGVVLGVVALRRSSAYAPSVVRTQAIVGIGVSVLWLGWLLYHFLRGT